MSKNRVIGCNNQLPWHLPADLQHFKATTLNKPIIMGRKTYDSLGRPLPKRRNIVVSRQQDLHIEGCEVFSGIEQAIAATNDADEVVIIGGATLYQQALSWTDKLYLTMIDLEIGGDAFFPEWDEHQWKVVKRESFQPDKDNIYAYEFLTLIRLHPKSNR